MNIDKQRIAAVRALEALGYTYRGGQWLAPADAATPLSLMAKADAMHGALMRRADELAVHKRLSSRPACWIRQGRERRHSARPGRIPAAAGARRVAGDGASAV
jgi:hypothetical protein